MPSYPWKQIFRVKLHFSREQKGITPATGLALYQFHEKVGSVRATNTSVVGISVL